ncbi:MAG: hypothetical protein AAGA92_09685 [Planctomycetota bacterium]
MASDARVELPPLRLHHFFAATAVAAVTLAGMKIVASDTASGRVWLSGGVPAVFTLQSLAMLFVLFGFAWRRRGLRFPSQPGHGVLLMLTVSHVYTVAVLMTAQLMPDLLFGPGEPGPLAVLTRIALEWAWPVVSLFSLCLCLWCAKTLADATRWRAFFWFAALMSALVLLSNLLIEKFFTSYFFALGSSTAYWISMGVYYGTPALEACLLAVVAAIDYRRSVSRHWSHWLGVVLAIAAVATNTAQILWQILSPAWSAYPPLAN